MSNNMLEYKGYLGSLSFSSEDRCFMGKIEFIEDLIMFDGQSVEELEAAFQDAVDSYVAFCHDRGKEPGTTFKGSLNVRLGPELHRGAAIAARKQGQTLNEFIKQAVNRSVHQDQQPNVEIEKRVHIEMSHHRYVLSSAVDTLLRASKTYVSMTQSDKEDYGFEQDRTDYAQPKVHYHAH